jgi:hypothetical protein
VKGSVDIRVTQLADKRSSFAYSDARLGLLSASTSCCRH